MVTKKFDLVVLGSGPAGEKGASQVAYFETIGGRVTPLTLASRRHERRFASHASNG